MKRIVKIVIFAALLVALLPSGHAHAHATPVTYSPESSSIVEDTPEFVSIRFTERIEESVSSISVFGPGGEPAHLDAARTDPQNQRVFEVPVEDQGKGNYTVSWKVVSADDGHFTKGVFLFRVSKEGGVLPASLGQIQIQHLTTLPEATIVWVELLGQSLLLGFLVLFMFLWRPLRGNPRTQKLFEKTPLLPKRAIVFVVLSSAIAIAGAITFIVLKTFDLQQLHPGAFGETLEAFLATAAGSFTLYRIAAIAAFALLFALAYRKITSSERRTKWEYVLLGLILFAIFAKARVSHAAAAHFLPDIGVLFMFVHLAFKNLLVGSLAAFMVLFAPLIRRTRDRGAQLFAFVSFSKLLAIVLGAAGIAGVYITWLDLKDFSNMFTTEWGSRFVVLLTLGALLLALRLFHQLVIEPRAASFSHGEHNKKTIWNALLGKTLPVEFLVALGVLFVSGFLSITTPPFTIEEYSFVERTESQGAVVELKPHPYNSESFLVTATNDDGKEIAAKEATVALTNITEGIGPIIAPITKQFQGGYVFPRDILSPPGEWKADIRIERQEGYDATAAFTFFYPDDITTSRLDTEARSLNLFTLFMVGVALLLGAFAFVIFRFSKQILARLRATEATGNSSASFIFTPVWAGTLFSLFAALAIFSGTWIVYDSFVKIDFQKLCERNGHFWLQSAPLYDGKTISPNTVTGCTLDVGLYHFRDMRAYEYFLRPRQILAELETKPDNPRALEPTELVVRLSKTQDGQKVGPAQDIGIHHDRILHTIIIGEDLATFAHIHPEDLGPITAQMRENAEFPLTHEFPKAGRYTIITDYVVGGREFAENFPVIVSGDEQLPQPTTDFSRTKMFNDYEVTFNAPDTISAGEPAVISYFITKGGVPVTDLEPYLAATMHIAIVRTDLRAPLHTHGEIYLPGSSAFQKLAADYISYHSHFAPEKFGPRVQAGIADPLVFPQPGAYRIFGEFKHNGKVIVTRFDVEVE